MHSRQEPNADMPPNLPLKRTTPHIYTFTNTIQVPVNQEFPILVGAGTPILWPLIPTSNWNRVDIDNIYVRLQTDQGVQTEEHAGHMAVKSNIPGEWALSIPTPDRIASGLELRIRMDIKTYSSELDESAAAKIPWFESWREDIAVFLAPSDFINSNQQRFKRAVTDVLGQNTKQYSPHITAKLLIRYCLEKIESNGEYSDLYGETTRGLDVKGALPATSTGKGTACDMVCVCIATLRAAGIPARPVIGVTNYDTTGLKKNEPHYMVWGEYALPNSGWVPFNPKRMQGTIDNVPLDQPWQGLGTLQQLHTRVPIAYSFVSGGEDKAYDAIGPWGWIPIYKNRPLPVPMSIRRIPWYRSSTDEIYILAQYLPSIQKIQLQFKGSPGE